MARIKFTGYIAVIDLEPNESDPTGLSAYGYDQYASPGSPLRVGDLEDLEVELEE